MLESCDVSEKDPPPFKLVPLSSPTTPAPFFETALQQLNTLDIHYSKEWTHIDLKSREKIDTFFASLKSRFLSLVETYISSEQKDSFAKTIDLFHHKTRDNTTPESFRHFLSTLSETVQSFIQKFYNDNKVVLDKYMKNKQGEIAEKQLEIILNKITPNAHIINTGHLKNMGDFLIQRKDTPSILVVNKVCEKNIDESEVQYFLSVVKENNCNGIFLSQNSGIVNKNDYHIDFINGNVVIFLQSVDYSIDKIQNAIHALDSLSTKIKNTHFDDHLSQEVIQEINKEYQQFISKKECILLYLKENQRTLVNDIESLTFAHLEQYLSTKFVIKKKNDNTIVCNLCNKYSSHTLKGMSAHKRGCKKKHPIASA
jgi:hypothetical protein